MFNFFFKAKESDSKKSKELIKNAVRISGLDENQYTTVYACLVAKYGGGAIVEIVQQVLALANDRTEFAVITIDIDGNYKKVQKLDTRAMSVKQTKLGTWEVVAEDQEIECGSFMSYTTRNARTAQMIPIRQEAEVEVVREFLKSKMK